MNMENRLDYYSLLLGIMSLTALLFGVIPSVTLPYYNITVGFYDFIQFLPCYQSALAVISMSGMILTSLFAFMKLAPRIVCLIFASVSFLSSLAAVITLNISVVYSKKAVTEAVFNAAINVGEMNHGIVYNFVVAIFLVDSLCAVLLAALSYINSRNKMEVSRVKAVIKHTEKLPDGFKAPNEFK